MTKEKNIGLISAGIFLAGFSGYHLRGDIEVSREIENIKENSVIYRKVVDGERITYGILGDSRPREFGSEYWGVDDNCDGDIDRIFKDPFGRTASGVSYGLQAILRKDDLGFNEALSELKGERNEL